MNLSSTTSGNKTKYKLVFLGDQGVGKSCIIQKYIHNKFDEASNPTVGIDFLAKNLFYKNRNFRLQLWDTAGQQRFRSLIPSYLKDAISAIIVYDVTSKRSLENAERWLRLYNQNKVADGYSVLVGNKIDLSYRVVKPQQAKAVADSLKIDYFEISAKTGEHLQQLFLHLLDNLMEGKVNGTGNVLDAVKQQIKEEKDQQAIENGKEQLRSMRKSRRQEFPIDQTANSMNNKLNFSHSMHPGVGQVYGNGQSMPAMVIYAQPPPGGMQVTAPQPNIILSNVQPPPLNQKSNKKCCG